MKDFIKVVKALSESSRVKMLKMLQRGVVYGKKQFLALSILLCGNINDEVISKWDQGN